MATTSASTARGLHATTGGSSRAGPDQLALLWVLNLSDGGHTLLDVAERTRVPFSRVRRAAEALERVGLLAPCAARGE